MFKKFKIMILNWIMKGLKSSELQEFILLVFEQAYKVLSKDEILETSQQIEYLD